MFSREGDLEKEEGKKKKRVREINPTLAEAESASDTHKDMIRVGLVCASAVIECKPAPAPHCAEPGLMWRKQGRVFTSFCPARAPGTNDADVAHHPCEIPNGKITPGENKKDREKNTV